MLIHRWLAMRTLLKAILVIAILYITSYIVVRARWTHRWDKDGRNYMHFPAAGGSGQAAAPTWIYYFYRPLCIADEKLSGMAFHIGPHPEQQPGS